MRSSLNTQVLPFHGRGKGAYQPTFWGLWNCRSRPIRRLAGSGIVSVVLLAQLNACRPSPAAGVGSSKTDTSPEAFGPVVFERDPVSDRIFEYRSEIRRHYNAREFAELEKRGSETRNAQWTFADGTWRIVEFYRAFDPRREEPDSMWRLHEAIHKAWVEAYPESTTARVAEAAFWVEYAWQARGHGSAGEVTAEGRRLFAERLAAAQAALDASASLKERCPVWFVVQMRVALGLGWPRDRYDRLYLEAKAFAPGCWHFDTARANFLLPRWFGKRGEWEADAERQAMQPGSLGAAGYARVVASVSGYYDDLIRETRLSWPLAKEGFAALVRDYPESRGLLNVAARAACDARDREFAAPLFARIGSHPTRGPWGDEARFLQFRQWVMAREPAGSN